MDDKTWRQVAKPSELRQLSEELTELGVINLDQEGMQFYGEDYGLNFIDKGMSRAVYEIPETGQVAKLSILHSGITTNQNEAYIWDMLTQKYDTAPQGETNVRSRFVPIQEHGKEFTWLVQPQCVPLGQGNGYSEAVKQIRRDIPYLNLDSELLEEYNVCMYDTGDEVVAKILDYGELIPKKFIKEELGPDADRVLRGSVKGDYIR